MASQAKLLGWKKLSYIIFVSNQTINVDVRNAKNKTVSRCLIRKTQVLAERAAVHGGREDDAGAAGTGDRGRAAAHGHRQWRLGKCQSL